ncbi:Intraflagellar transport protein 57 homolog-like Protein [Tribolium castaneum]|uniref:Intraflagellar transport protein 57 homolog-like Protein n=1 Tax=Tribolium castaneum TaxID=7070 RepID=D2A1Z1_TRICA|nr:Intraflagellar transport protein 57 homolog-like Protein [Tribolium castaneum]
MSEESEQTFSAFSQMEGLLDKLKLYYFVVTKNPGEQFYLFALLAAYLIQKIGISFQTPQEDDDPNVTVEKILDVVRKNEIAVNFHANKLMQGVGEQVVYILDSLASKALEKNFMFQKPLLPEEKAEESELINDESEINLDRVEEEMLAAYTDDSDEENLFLLDNVKVARKEPQMAEIKMNVNEEAWKLELERVLPHLKITVKNENRDWRSHLEQMKQYKVSVDSSLGVVKTQLEKLHKEISQTLDKIASREKFLNRELENNLDEYRMLQDQLSKIRDAYKGISEGVAERNRELFRLTDRLETVKQQMEERGSSMTDGTPLVNIKKQLGKVKSEIVEMDVRIGILECILLQSKIRDEKNLETEFGQAISVF